jgi:sugar O-acyltransferase (sialic acid O-acetyltransferase NeuD family)
MSKEQIILIGGGGHCKSCIDVIEQGQKFEIVGILDLSEKYGQKILGYKIIGNDEDIPKFAKQGFSFLISIGQIAYPKLRIKLFKIIKDNGGNLPVIISPYAYISRHSRIGKGVIIMHNAIINANVVIGENCIINNKALIEHDVEIESNVHISTNTTINGECKIGENCLIGSSSILNHTIKIASNTIIGSGAVVTKDIIESGVYVGIPVKKIK